MCQLENSAIKTGLELANHLLKVLVNPTLGVSNRCKQYELQYVNNQQQYLINRLQKQHINKQKQHQQNFSNRQQQHLNKQKQRHFQDRPSTQTKQSKTTKQRFNDRRQQQHSSN